MLLIFHAFVIRPAMNRKSAVTQDCQSRWYRYELLPKQTAWTKNPSAILAFSSKVKAARMSRPWSRTPKDEWPPLMQYSLYRNLSKYQCLFRLRTSTEHGTWPRRFRPISYLALYFTLEAPQMTAQPYPLARWILEESLDFVNKLLQHIEAAFYAYLQNVRHQSKTGTQCRLPSTRL